MLVAALVMDTIAMMRCRVCNVIMAPAEREEKNRAPNGLGFVHQGCRFLACTCVVAVGSPPPDGIAVRHGDRCPEYVELTPVTPVPVR